MYYIYDISGPSLLIESTDSMLLVWVVKGRQSSVCTDASCLNVRSWQSLRLILNLDSDKSGCFNHRDELNSAVLYVVRIGCDVHIEQ